MSMHIDFNEEGNKSGVVHKAKVMPIPEPIMMRKLHRYTLAAMVVCGSDLPRFRSKTHIGKLRQLSVCVSIGMRSLVTRRQPNVGGQTEWNEMVRADDIELGDTPTEIPDVFVYLIVGKVCVVSLPHHALGGWLCSCDTSVACVVVWSAGQGPKSSQLRPYQGCRPHP